MSVFATGIDGPPGTAQRPAELRVLRPAQRETAPDPLPDRDDGEAAAAAAPASEPEPGSPVREIAPAETLHPDAAGDGEATAAAAQSEMFSASAGRDLAAAGMPGDARAEVRAAEPGEGAWSEPTDIGRGGYAPAETAPMETVPVETAPLETAHTADAAPVAPVADGAAPVEPGPVGRPSDLVQTVEEMLTPVRPAAADEPADSRPDLRSVLRPEGRPAAESEPEAGGGKRDSVFSFFRGRRKETPKRGGGNEDRDSSGANPAGDAQSESTVRLITDSDRSRRETAGTDGTAPSAGAGGRPGGEAVCRRRSS